MLLLQLERVLEVIDIADVAVKTDIGEGSRSVKVKRPCVADDSQTGMTIRDVRVWECSKEEEVVMVVGYSKTQTLTLVNYNYRERLVTKMNHYIGDFVDHAIFHDQLLLLKLDGRIQVGQNPSIHWMDEELLAEYDHHEVVGIFLFTEFLIVPFKFGTVFVVDLVQQRRLAHEIALDVEISIVLGHVKNFLLFRNALGRVYVLELIIDRPKCFHRLHDWTGLVDDVDRLCTLQDSRHGVCLCIQHKASRLFQVYSASFPPRSVKCIPLFEYRILANVHQVKFADSVLIVSTGKQLYVLSCLMSQSNRESPQVLQCVDMEAKDSIVLLNARREKPIGPENRLTVINGLWGWTGKYVFRLKPSDPTSVFFEELPNLDSAETVAKTFSLDVLGLFGQAARAHLRGNSNDDDLAIQMLRLASRSPEEIVKTIGIDFHRYDMAIRLGEDLLDRGTDRLGDLVLECAIQKYFDGGGDEDHGKALLGFLQRHNHRARELRWRWVHRLCDRGIGAFAFGLSPPGHDDAGAILQLLFQRLLDRRLAGFEEFYPDLLDSGEPRLSQEEAFRVASIFCRESCIELDPHILLGTCHNLDLYVNTKTLHETTQAGRGGGGGGEYLACHYIDRNHWNLAAGVLEEDHHYGIALECRLRNLLENTRGKTELLNLFESHALSTGDLANFRRLVRCWMEECKFDASELEDFLGRQIALSTEDVSCADLVCRYFENRDAWRDHSFSLALVYQATSKLLRLS